MVVAYAYGLESLIRHVTLYYAVLPDGLQPISPVLAAILRNTNSYGLQQPPRLGADEVAKLPVSRHAGQRALPGPAVSLVDASHDPVTCAYWSKPAGAASSTLSLLSGSALPVPDGVRTSDLVGSSNGATPGRDGARHRVLRPECRRRRVRAGRWIAVLGLRHRRPIRHRHRS